MTTTPTCTCRKADDGTRIDHDPSCPEHNDEPLRRVQGVERAPESAAWIDWNDTRRADDATREMLARNAHRAGWNAGRAAALEQAFVGLGDAVKSATRAVELLAGRLEPSEALSELVRDRHDAAERNLLRAWADDAAAIAETHRADAEALSTASGRSSKAHGAAGAADALERIAKRMRVAAADHDLEDHEKDPS